MSGGENRREEYPMGTLSQMWTAHKGKTANGHGVEAFPIVLPKM